MSPFIERLGWVLIHSLWQLALLAVVAFVAQRSMRRTSAAARYAVLLGMLGMVVAVPLITGSALPTQGAVPVAEQSSPMSARPSAPVLSIDTVDRAVAPSAVSPKSIQPPLPVASTDLEPVVPVLPLDPVKPTWSEWVQRGITPWLSTIVWGWSFGVLAFAIRPLWSWFTVRRLRTLGVSPVPEVVQAALVATAHRLGLTQAVRVLQSSVVQVPIVAGYLKPVILLPASIVTGLPASQLQAILAHELAHIRRHDYLVNLLQTLVETVFFYHPAVWWLSHQIRCERENCCDDIAVSALGSRLDYSRALLALEEIRVAQTPLAVGAGGGSLLARVTRLFRREIPPEQVPGGSLALGALLISGVMTFAALIASDKVSSETVGPTAHADISHGPLIARLPGGIEIELVGVTRNTAPAKEGWRADGSPIEGAGDWPRGATFARDGDRITMTTDTASKLTPDPQARDILFECRGAASPPSWTITRQSGWTEFHAINTESGLRRRLSLHRKDQALNTTVEMAYTDSPWGPWQRIGADGKRINSIETFAPDQQLYNDIRIERLGSSSNKTEKGSPLELVLDEPATSDDYQSGVFDIEVRLIGKNQKVLPTYPQPQPMKDGRRTVTWTTGGPVPLESLQYAEFRLRPYRHFITFENVPLEKSAAGQVAVKHRSIPEPPRPTPDDRFVAHLPDGMDIELLRIVRNDLSVEKSWLPNGEVLPSVIDWPNRSFFRVNENSVSSSNDGPGSDRVWDIAYAYRPTNNRPLISVSFGNGSVMSSIGVESVGLRTIALAPEDPSKLTKLQLRVGNEPWGQWIQVGADGKVLNPQTINQKSNSPDPLIWIAGAGIDEDNPDRSWFKWMALPHADQLYSMEVRAIDDDGQVYQSNSSVHKATAATMHEITQWFDLPVEKLNRFEYRMRPYRHLVTYDNICTDPAKPTEVRVKIEPIVYPNEVAPQISLEASASSPRPLLAKLPGGLEVELVGVTKNFAPAKEGWMPDGSPIGEIEEWPSRLIVNRKGVKTSRSDDGTSDPAARDLLVMMRGLQSQPEICLLDVQATQGWSLIPHADPYRNRLSLLLNKPSDTLTFRMAISDAPWGPYQHVGLDGKLLNELELAAPEAEHYGQIRVVRCGPHPEAPDQSELTLVMPAKYREQYSFAIHPIDTEGKELFALSSIEYDDSGTATAKYRTDPGFPGKIARWEYRLRPYRHFIKFENVSFEPGKKTEPKVSVESIEVAKTVEEPIAQPPTPVPQPPRMELIGLTRDSTPKTEAWQPNGQPMPPPEWVRELPKLIAEDKGPPSPLFLFEVQGLRELPSIYYQHKTAVVFGDTELPKGRAYRQAVLYDELRNTTSVPGWGDYPTALVSDEPWGPWRTVTKDGQLAQPLSNDMTYRSGYEHFTFHGVRPLTPDAKDPATLNDTMAVVQQQLSEVYRQYAIEIQSVTQGEGTEAPHYETITPRWARNVIPSQEHAVELNWPFDPAKTNHIRFRIRPFRHQFVFENVNYAPSQRPENYTPFKAVYKKLEHDLPKPVALQPAQDPTKSQPPRVLIEPVEGRVLLPNGQPAAEVPVVLRRMPWGQHLLPQQVEKEPEDPHDLTHTVTDAQGRFAFRDVPIPELYRDRDEIKLDVVAKLDSHAVAWSRVIVGTPVTLTLQPEAKLAGKITGPSGQPVAGAVIQAAWIMSLRHITQADLEDGRWPSWKDRNFVGLTDCQLVPTAKTNENGEFTLSGLPRGLGIRLFVRSEEFEPQWFDAATATIEGENLRLTKRPVASGPLTIRMQTPRELLTIRVVDDATGAPLEGAKVIAHPSGQLPVSQTGNESVFRLSAGDVPISAELPMEKGYLRGWGLFNAGQTHSSEIRLKRGIPLRGRVIDEDTKQPLAGIEVRVDGRLDEIQIGNACLWSKTGNDGSFELLLSQGKHIAWVRPFKSIYRNVGVSMLDGQFGVMAHHSATIDTNQLPDTLELALERAQGIEGVVLDPQGELAAGVQYRGLYKTDYGAQSFGDVTTEQGEFVISEPFGAEPLARSVPLDVLFWDEQRGLVGTLRVDPVVASVAHEVELQPAGQVTGRVVDDQGRPVAHALVQCGLMFPSFTHQTGAVIARPVRTGEDGRFEIRSGVAGYRLDLEVDRPGYVKAWKALSLTKTEQDKDLGEIVLEIEKPVQKLTVELPKLQGLTPEAQYTALSGSFDSLVQQVDAARKVARNYDVVPDNTSQLYAQAMWDVAQSARAGDVERKALVWMIGMRRLSGNHDAKYEKLRQQAGARLIEAYADQPDVAAVADSVAWTQYSLPEGTHRAALVFLEKSPDRSARGICCLLAAESLVDRGPVRSRPIAPETISRVEPLLKRVVSEFADLPQADDWRKGTLGECAQGWLETLQQVQQGVAVPDMVWNDSLGQPLRISDLKGKVVVLDHGTLGDDAFSRTLLNQAGPDRVIVIQVSAQNVETAWKALDGLAVPRRQISYEEANRFERMWNIRTWPGAIVLNEQGGVAGEDMREKLPEVLSSVLKSKAAVAIAPRQAAAPGADASDSIQVQSPELGEWGETTDGLRSRLQLIRDPSLKSDTSRKVGSPVEVALEIENVSQAEKQLSVSSVFSLDDVQITGPDGEPCPDVRGPLSVLERQITILPGETKAVIERADLSEQFLMTEPGEYRIRAKSPTVSNELSSGELRITLAEGEVSPIRRVYRDVVAKAPTGSLLLVVKDQLWVFVSGQTKSTDPNGNPVVKLWHRKDSVPTEELPQGAVELKVPNGTGHWYAEIPHGAKQVWKTVESDLQQVCSGLAVALQSHAPGADRSSSGDGSIPTRISEDKARKELEANDPQKPWRAKGRVVDGNGKPLAGVTVRAATGMGTLLGGGSGTTDAEGRYDFRFGLGIHMGKLPDGKPSPQTQYALISAQLGGHFEKTFNRQGNGIGSLEPVSDEVAQQYGVEPNQIVLPNKPREVDFVMLPAAKVSGTLIGENDQPLKDYSVSLSGDNLPPGSSVLAQVETDEKGRFEIKDIPTIVPYQFVVRKPAKELTPPWNDSWASGLMTFVPPGENDAEMTSLNDHVTVKSLKLKISGPGVHGRDAQSRAKLLRTGLFRLERQIANQSDARPEPTITWGSLDLKLDRFVWVLNNDFQPVPPLDLVVDSSSITENVNRTKPLVERLFTDLEKSEKRARGSIITPCMAIKFMLAFGPDATFNNPDVTPPTPIRVEDWLCGGPKHRGIPVWQVTPHGVQTQPYRDFNDLYVFEGAYGSFLNAMAESGLPLTHSLRASNSNGDVEDRKIQDVLMHYQWNMRNRPDDYRFTEALLRYGQLKANWKDAQGKERSTLDLVRSTFRVKPSDSINVESMRLTVLAIAWNLHQQEKRSAGDEELWAQIEKHLQESISDARLDQLPDGSWPTSVHSELSATSQMLKWIVEATPPAQLKDDWISNAVEYQLTRINDRKSPMTSPHEFLDTVHALRVYRDKRFGKPAKVGTP